MTLDDISIGDLVVFVKFKHWAAASDKAVLTVGKTYTVQYKNNSKYVGPSIVTVEGNATIFLDELQLVPKSALKVLQLRIANEI